MKLRQYSLAAVLAATLAAAGCSTSPTNAQIGTGVGAVAGGVAGNVLFGNTLGTVGGAAAGALIGNEVGSAADSSARLARRMHRCAGPQQHPPSWRVETGCNPKPALRRISSCTAACLQKAKSPCAPGAPTKPTESAAHHGRDLAQDRLEASEGGPSLGGRGVCFA